MKDILIIANFCRDFSETDNGRFMYLCKELSKENNVEIITSDFMHGHNKHKEPLNIEWPFKITFIHEPGYEKNISVKRFISHRIWGNNVYKYVLNRKKAEVVYCAMPSLTVASKMAKYCKRNKIKFIVDVQDLWPEAFKMVFNIPILSDIIFAPFNLLANRAYAQADEIFAVSQTYVDRALSVNKKCKQGHAVFLGTDLSTFDANVKDNQIMNKPAKQLWLGYCGSMGDSYDLDCVIDALAMLDNPPKLIAMGDGERKKHLEECAESKGINVEFTGRLPYNKMCGLLNACDIAVNPIRGNSAASIINKHGDYAAAGLPVINTQDSKEYRKLIDDYHMGINCENGNVTEVSRAIYTLCGDAQLRMEMGSNARRCAEEKFDRKETYKSIWGGII